MSLTRRALWSIPRLQSRRGAGLGNEVIPWAKAYIASVELDARLIDTPWSLNPRGYRKDFLSRRSDRLTYTAAGMLPRIEINRELAMAHDDYVDVVRDLVDEVSTLAKPTVLWHSSGMSGGYYGIRRAKGFLQRKLFGPAHVLNDTYKLQGGLNTSKLQVALHIRAGDFLVDSVGPRPGEFNKVVPIEWYRAVAQNLLTRFGDMIEFAVFTDDENNVDIVNLKNALPTVELVGRQRPLLSDLHAMSTFDLLVCSVSSMSMLAGFLSDRPYVWFEPHLGEIGDFRSIWGHESAQRTGLTVANAASVDYSAKDSLLTRGLAAGLDGSLTEAGYNWLASQLDLKNSGTDLLMYGVVPKRW
ncbi:O-fucosyltransferase family protein [Rhodococcus cercidiphylli]|uniref:Uncharacterized protein n=1 Tax=Rhodococcus cercidiphylli TaxID=489916 RepID=A0ABU4B3W3_9NOCA|nr:hypothetical protein [Rhodococcus cercidiphylli]MDV6233171.1 hypothetical protein [Rhodococcus cercidiphylli]